MPAYNELESYPWYMADWRSSDEVASMTAAEQGVYRNLLDVCWAKGDLPTDLVALERLSFVSQQEFRKAWPKVSRCFVEVEGRLRNRKVDAKRPEVLRSKADRSKGGRIRAEQMWSNRRASSSAIAQLQPPPTPTPSPSLVVEEFPVVQERRVTQLPPPRPDQLDGLAEDTLIRMAPAEPATVGDLDAREIALILIDAVNPRIVADTLVRDRQAYLECQAANGEKAKPLRWWLKDGGWKIPLPAAKIATPAADPVSRLMSMGRRK